MQEVRNDTMPSSLTNMFKIKTNDRDKNNSYKVRNRLFKGELYLYSAASLWNGFSNTASKKGVSVNKF